MGYPHLHHQLSHLHLHSHNPLLIIANDQASLNLHSAGLLNNPYSHILAITKFIR